MRDGTGIEQVRSRLGNLFGVVRQLFLFPAVGDGFQQCDQCGGCGQDNPVFRAESGTGPLPELPGKSFSRQEHDDGFRARRKLGKFFGAQLLQMLFPSAAWRLIHWLRSSCLSVSPAWR